ncbi:MAG: nickel-dependent hydrogenase, b-type cytochrome subunit/YceI-like family protein [Hellea sp.]|nr:nickel-dependent hydrogenase, b-type cytochrome subunit/YceI-like family protein [Hellea sp.]
MTNQQRYNHVSITLHWVMAALILFMIWLGLNMEDDQNRYQLHKSIGITLLILTVARIIWRLFNKPPPLPHSVKPIEARLSKLVQFGFYALMLMVPLGGWLLVSISEFRVPTVLYGIISWPSLPLPRSKETAEVVAFIHGNAGKWGFGFLLLLHVVGALKHEIVDKDGVLKRMIPGLGKTDPPAVSKGIFITLFVSIGLFATIALIPVIATSLSAQSQQHDSISTNWTMLENSGSIHFAGTLESKPFDGEFENWDAQIAFYARDLENSEVLVTVDLASASTGTKIYDDSLIEEEWFDVSSDPTASVRLTNFQATPYGFAADAALTLKGQTVSAPFYFTLEIEGDTTTMKGETSFSRTSLSLGQKSYPGGTPMSEEISVSATLSARRN